LIVAAIRCGCGYAGCFFFLGCAYYEERQLSGAQALRRVLDDRWKTGPPPRRLFFARTFFSCAALRLGARICFVHFTATFVAPRTTNHTMISTAMAAAASARASRRPRSFSSLCS
jgi:hypothetical protein